MKINDLLFRFGTIFNISRNDNHKEIKKLYIDDDKEALENDWKVVGSDIRSVLFGKSNN